MNYFLTIAFDWQKVFEMLDIPKEDQEGFVLNEDYQILQEDYGTVCFEYCVFLGEKKRDHYTSIIFDQQNKLFSESTHSFYNRVLQNKNSIVSISCGIKRFYLHSNKSCFWIDYLNSPDSLIKKRLFILFDQEYFQVGDINPNREYERIPFEVIGMLHEKKYHEESRPLFEKIDVQENDFWLQIRSQSRLDAGTGSYEDELSKFLMYK